MWIGLFQCSLTLKILVETARIWCVPIGFDNSQFRIESHVCKFLSRWFKITYWNNRWWSEKSTRHYNHHLLVLVMMGAIFCFCSFTMLNIKILMNERHKLITPSIGKLKNNVFCKCLSILVFEGKILLWSWDEHLYAKNWYNILPSWNR